MSIETDRRPVTNTNASIDPIFQHFQPGLNGFTTGTSSYAMATQIESTTGLTTKNSISMLSQNQGHGRCDNGYRHRQGPGKKNMASSPTASETELRNILLQAGIFENNRGRLSSREIIPAKKVSLLDKKLNKKNTLLCSETTDIRAKISSTNVSAPDLEAARLTDFLSLGGIFCPQENGHEEKNFRPESSFQVPFSQIRQYGPKTKGRKIILI